MIPSGFLLIDKPEGITSFEVLRELKKTFYGFLDEERGVDSFDCSTPELKKALKTQIKDLALGHCGTLDPFATGLLIVGVGRATQLSQYFLGGKKTYRATLEFGAKTSSGDLTDPVIARTDVIPGMGSEMISAALQKFVTEPYFQTPPMTSAKKIGGEKLYALARRGITVERKAERKVIEAAEVFSYTPPLLDFQVTVQSGTYIRVLGEDLAEKCGSLGYLRSLRRLSSSRFSVELAVKLPDLKSLTFLSSAFIPFDQVFPDIDCIQVTDCQIESLKRGQQSCLQEMKLSTAYPTPLKSKEGKLIALARFQPEKNEWRTDRVFSSFN